MMSDYRLVWSTVSYAVDEEGQALRQEKSRRLQQFYNDKWKAANKQVGLCPVGLGAKGPQLVECVQQVAAGSMGCLEQEALGNVPCVQQTLKSESLGGAGPWVLHVCR